MKGKITIKTGTLLVLAGCALLILSGALPGTQATSSLSGSGTAIAAEKGTATAVFKVRCYDEGKSALQGMMGIKSIKTGFHYLHETDTVTYDPAVITVDEMEAALKQAGTYVETISGKERN